MQRYTFDDTKQYFTIGDTAEFIVIPTNTIYNFRVLGVGADASGNTATYEIEGTAKNIAGTVSVANVTATEITDEFTITGMSAEANDANKALVITATGKAATAISWSAFVEWQEITFA
jgi:cystathionine beta-lyase/cystathionine gamma-synthase